MRGCASRTGHVQKPREAKFPPPKRPTSAVSSIAPTTTRRRRRTARTDHTHMQEKLHCDNTLHQSHQEGPQLPDARLRQQREAIEGEDSVVRPQFVLASATWRATQTGHGSGNPSASWKERASCHGEWQRSSARLRRRGAQEKRPQLSRRTGGWRSEAPAGWGCPSGVAPPEQPASQQSAPREPAGAPSHAANARRYARAGR